MDGKVVCLFVFKLIVLYYAILEEPGIAPLPGGALVFLLKPGCPRAFCVSVRSNFPERFCVFSHHLVARYRAGTGVCFYLFSHFLAGES